MPGKKPPYTHREMAKIIFDSESNRHSLPARLKVEAYTLFFTALPHVIAVAIWVGVIAAFYWGVKLI